MMRDLAGKVAVVTGGGSGIGRTLVTAFAAEDMTVAVLDYDYRTAAAAADKVAASGGRALAIGVDVSERRAVVRAAERVVAELGGCHVLCNNAGVGVHRSLLELTDADWDWILGVDLLGVIHGLQAFVPAMVTQGEGHIVNTSSMWGMLSAEEPGTIAYHTAKYAVVGLSESLPAELGRYGIGCSLLCPAGVRTNIIESGAHRPERFGGPEPLDDDIAESTAHERALGMDPEDVAELTIRAVKDDRLYVLTHPETRRDVEARHNRILAAFDWSATWFRSR